MGGGGEGEHGQLGKRLVIYPLLYRKQLAHPMKYTYLLRSTYNHYVNFANGRDTVVRQVNSHVYKLSLKLCILGQYVRGEYEHRTLQSTLLIPTNHHHYSVAHLQSTPFSCIQRRHDGNGCCHGKTTSLWPCLLLINSRTRNDWLACSYLPYI